MPTEKTAYDRTPDYTQEERRRIAIAYKDGVSLPDLRDRFGSRVQNILASVCSEYGVPMRRHGRRMNGSA